MSNLAPLFTVFTPTYNRGHTLPKVYECLCRQTLKDFEWVIVDDGSTDDTPKLVSQWINDGNLLIRYFKKENGGKHTAFNRGVIEARGYFFLALDSDDTCTPETLERFRYHWDKIPADLRHKYSGVTCLCKYPNGRIVGTRFPSEEFDSDLIALATRYSVKGEKWGFVLTEILRAYPFPEVEGEKFVPEGLIWNRISKKYIMRFVNEPLRIYEIQPDSLSVSQMKIRARSPISSTRYYYERLQFSLPLMAKIKTCINFFRFRSHIKYRFKEAPVFHQLPLMAWTLEPIGFMVFMFDRYRLKNMK